MQRQLIITNDGSHSISIPDSGISYHSMHGAIQESTHIFIDAGLKELLKTRNEISIFEVGLGTGLNALLTFIATAGFPVKVYYETVETNPVEDAMVTTINYTEILGRPDLQHLFLQIHQLPWNSPQHLADNFYFYKRNADVADLIFTTTYNLVYFDAFAPDVQPELWTTEVFKKLYDALEQGGLMLTYCSKVTVRKAMEAAGFLVEKVPGPWGKREILRAVKI
ncbi:MAG: tRNA (5-methylaminomethyl-2-thiouridine)(34)-methyltransferase MnmD [Chitinophagaceae bacterium]|nr:tRNA (5-methylaminomethyl-2-thiouridine)(34)-methyltransferase MnmD [Chitinophagaceae bacterium]